MKNSEMLKEINRVLTAYIEYGLSDESVVCGLYDVRKLDGRQSWSRKSVSNTTLHDPDYGVFSHFVDPESVVLDVGAHFGYSVTSIWASECRSKVISFEANPAYAGLLASLKQICPGRFNFEICGLSDVEAVYTFIVPVLNGVLLGGLGTMDDTLSIQSLIIHSVSYYNLYLSHEPFRSFRLCCFPVSTRTLDGVLKGEDVVSSDSNIVAIKVDVEGLEANVLRGAAATLRKHKPLILTECGGKIIDVSRFMLQEGYGFASREGLLLTRTNKLSNRLNQFFVHTSRIAEYRRLQLLTEG